MANHTEALTIAAEEAGAAARPRARRPYRCAVALAPESADPRRRGRDRRPHDPRSERSRQIRRNDRRDAAGRRSPPSRRARTSRSTSCTRTTSSIVIDKPAGLVVHPAAGHATGTLVNALIAHCGDSLSGIGGVKRPGIVHRLDKDTTGLMVVAKNDRAHKALAAQFAEQGRGRPLGARLSRLRLGRAAAATGTIDAPLDRHPAARGKRAVRAGGREAVTHWQLLETLCRQGRQKNAGREPARLPAGNRPDPPDPRPPRPYRPSAARR